MGASESQLVQPRRMPSPLSSVREPLTVDTTGRQLYWYDGNTIQQQSLDEGDPQVSVYVYIPLHVYTLCTIHTQRFEAANILKTLRGILMCFGSFDCYLPLLSPFLFVFPPFLSLLPSLFDSSLHSSLLSSSLLSSFLSSPSFLYSSPLSPLPPSSLSMLVV